LIKTPRLWLRSISNRRSKEMLPFL